ncbi:anti-sigma factor family protein [Gemmatimonadota bacterium]
MRCRNAERLLYLHREGERTAADQRRLDHHLRACSSCAAEAGRIHETLSRVESLRSPVPDGSNPESMTESVMTRIRYLEGGVRYRTGAGIRPMGAGMFGFSPRTIVAAAALLLGIGVLTEGMLILDRITLLEKRLEVHQVGVGTSETRYVTADDLDRGVRRLSALEGQGRTDRSGGSAAEEWIMIRRSDLRKILSRYGRTDISPETLMRELTRQLPDLREITIEDGLNRTELQTLLEHSSAIISAVRGL